MLGPAFCGTRPARAGPALLHAEPKDQFASNISEDAAVKPRPQEPEPPGPTGPSCDEPARPCGRTPSNARFNRFAADPGGSPTNARSNDRIHSLFTMINNAASALRRHQARLRATKLVFEPHAQTSTPVGRIHCIRTRSLSRRSSRSVSRPCGLLVEPDWSVSRPDGLLVEPDGIEPTTSCLQSTRSPN